MISLRYFFPKIILHVKCIIYNNIVKIRKRLFFHGGFIFNDILTWNVFVIFYNFMKTKNQNLIVIKPENLLGIRW